MASTYEPIASQTLGSDTTDVTFSSIPGTYTDLVIVVVGRSQRTAGTSDSLVLEFNSDTASNYSKTLLYGTGSAAGSTRDSSVVGTDIGRLNTSASSNTDPSTIVLHLMSYSFTSVNKTVLAASAGTKDDWGIARGVGLWRSTSAITSVKLRTWYNAGFKSGATFSLYGIRAA